MNPPSPNAGFTLLEVLIVLAILAAMTVVLAGSIRPTPQLSSKSATSEALLASMRYEAVLSGVPQLLTIDAAELSPGARGVLAKLAGNASPLGDASLTERGSVTVVAYPDGGLTTIQSANSRGLSSMLQFNATP